MSAGEGKPASRPRAEKDRRATPSPPTPDPSTSWSDAAGTWQYVPSRSASMREVEQRALRVAPSTETILILGETGVGKDLLARLIHQNSLRRERPFVHLNCASLSEGLLESELFGHMRGSYTGANENRPGQFEIAAGGTLFLDEIGEIPPRLQAKLLHVLQERKLYRVGGRQVVSVDVRVLAATNRDLTRDIQAGTFRQDLYYRLGVVALRIPPLRQRLEDLDALARFFLHRYAALYNRPDLAQPDGRFLELVKRSPWPGNIRELENFIKRMILLGGLDEVADELTDAAAEQHWEEEPPADAPPPPRSLREVARQAMKTAERQAILQALTRSSWNRRKAARELRMSYRSLLYKIKDYTLVPTGSGDGEDSSEPA